MCISDRKFEGNQVSKTNQTSKNPKTNLRINAVFSWSHLFKMGYPILSWVRDGDCAQEAVRI